MKKLIMGIIFAWLYPIIWILPRSRDEIVFCASDRKAFSDNSRYLFLHVVESRTNKRTVFLTNNDTEVQKYRKSGLPILKLSSIQGVFRLIRAKTIFVTHGRWDAFPVLMAGATVINLWHGVPIKYVGDDNLDFQVTKRDRWAARVKKLVTGLFPFLNYIRSDLMLCPSERLLANYRSAFGSHTSFFLAPQPRIVALSQGYEFKTEWFRETRSLAPLEEAARVFSWLPTHRVKSGQARLSAFSMCTRQSMVQLDAMLGEINGVLVVKPHPIDTVDARGLCEGLNRVHLYEEADPYPLLARTDVLITDYSSVYFDFSITLRPTIFYCPDLDEYLRDVSGMYFDYRSLTGGVIVNEFSDLISVIRSTGDAIPEFINNDWCKTFIGVEYAEAGSACETVLETLSTSRRIF